MAAPEYVYSDNLGRDSSHQQWGAVAEQARQIRSLKGINPGATQYVNAGGTPPVRPHNPSLAKGPINVTPPAPSIAPPQNAGPQPHPSTLGQSHPHTTPTSPAAQVQQQKNIQTMYPGQHPDTLLAPGMRRGYGPSAGLVPGEGGLNNPMGGTTLRHYFGHMASLPEASPQTQYFNKLAQDAEG